MTDVQKEIASLIQKNGGSIDNLSVLNDQLRKKYPAFYLKDYGYSRFSCFLRSIENIGVRGNAVSLKAAVRSRGRGGKKS